MLRHNSSRWKVVTDAENWNKSRLSSINRATHVHVSYLCYWRRCACICLCIHRHICMEPKDFYQYLVEYNFICQSNITCKTCLSSNMSLQSNAAKLDGCRWQCLNRIPVINSAFKTTNCKRTRSARFKTWFYKIKADYSWGSSGYLSLVVRNISEVYPARIRHVQQYLRKMVSSSSAEKLPLTK